MIESTDQTVLEWIAGVVPDVDVVLAAPGADVTSRRVVVTLLQIVATRSGRIGGPIPGQLRPLTVALQYLVTAGAQTPREAHQLLGRVLVAGLGHDAFRLELAPLPHALWAALGATLRPGFVIEAPAVAARTAPPTPRVREAVVETAPMRVIAGILLGPGDRPLSDVQLVLPTLDRAIRTDTHGRFRVAVPASARPSTTLVARVKGREFSFPLSLTQAGTPNVFRCHELES